MKISEYKKRLRGEVLAARSRLPQDYCQAADRAISQQVLAVPEYQAADVIFCFVSTKEEISTQPIITDAWTNGKRVGVPLCTAKGMMEVREIRSMADLQPGFYGILEPVETTPLIRPEEIGFVIVPCVSSSYDGRRLGYGGGYYDRYLPLIKAPAAVLCRERLIRADIPAEPHDIKIDMVITERDLVQPTSVKISPNECEGIER